MGLVATPAAPVPGGPGGLCDSARDRGQSRMFSHPQRSGGPLFAEAGEVVSKVGIPHRREAKVTSASPSFFVCEARLISPALGGYG